MHKNPCWLIFLGIFSIILLWYSADAAWKLWRYQSLTATTQPLHLQFSVFESASDKFFIEVSYTYEVNGKEQHGQTVLRDTLFRNKWVAEEALPEFQEKTWKVWYAPSSPQYSTLQKSFPFKECLYASVLWLLLIYFLWIGYRVARNYT